MTFDPATLELLRATKEVRVRAKSKRRPVTIWVVVVDDVAFVRSVPRSNGAVVHRSGSRRASGAGRR